MISFNELIELIGNSFFDGSFEIAGVVVYIMAILSVLALTKEVFIALIVGMGITLLFSLMGVLSTEIAILMIIVSVLGLAYTSRSVWSH